MVSPTLAARSRRSTIRLAQSSTKRSASTTRTRLSAITPQPRPVVLATYPIRNPAAFSRPSTPGCPPTSTTRRLASTAWRPRDRRILPAGRDLTTSFGFLDEGGAITTIDPFGSTFTQALGVNDLGEIVGFYVDANGIQHGYIDNGGVFTSFDPPGSASTTINGLNDKGDIVGFYTNPVTDPSTALSGLPYLSLRPGR